MRPSSVEPFSPDPSALHPMLQKALDNLDVQLEDELTRYRQQRYRQLGRTRQPDLAPPRKSPSVAPAPLTPPLPSLTDYAPDDTLPQPINLDIWETDASDAPSSSHLSNFDARRVVREMRAAPIAPQPPKFTQDYFASSEELLKSGSSPAAQPSDRPSTLLDTLLTPLGVGSMLLLLLSSISLGYVILYPSSLGFLAALGRESDQKSIAAPTSPHENQSLSPNLASDEFIDVNLNTLSQLPKNDRPSTVVTVPQTAKPALSPTERPTERPTEPNSPLTDAPRLSAAVIEPPLETITLPSRPVIRQPAAPAAVPSAPQTAAVAPAPSPAPPALAE
ncbi:MAG: hypothetical protein HC781_03655, partial [Leptolyngbyaceae cyanobacterium CSU_1_4]|nr:hypothetical protein [Leptolyngbyaceae cyanobacterium CSU_1_4]